MKIYKIKVNGKSYRVELETIEQISTAPVEEKKKEESKKIVSNEGGKQVVSPIQGQVVNIKVKVGNKVKKGDVLLIVEAMKLENEIVSIFDESYTNFGHKGQNVKATNLSSLLINGRIYGKILGNNCRFCAGFGHRRLFCRRWLAQPHHDFDCPRPLIPRN